MSRKDELLKLAELFHSQAKLTLNRDTKQALRKIGDHYQRKAEELRLESLDRDIKQSSSRPGVRHHKSAA